MHIFLVRSLSSIITVFAHRPIYTSNAEYFGEPVGYAKYLQDSFEGSRK